jgi:tungstate transport system substrate-binding protein
LTPQLSSCTAACSTSLAVLLSLAGCGQTPEAKETPEHRSIILATTTSTQDSGLLDELIPVFEKQTGYRVKPIAVGTGEALAMGERGDADVLLAHAPAKEKEMVAAGFAINRRIVMHNDFLIVGPEGDPAGIHGSDNGAESVAKIAQAGARFTSRGDNSGTHLREMSLWKAAALEPEGDWYISTGQGMGATLLIAADKGAYVLTDRGTHLALKERTGLVPHVEGDPLFLNIYSVTEVNPERFPKVNDAGARAFSEFIRGGEAQEIIRTFGVEQFGQPLFFPDAGKSEESLAI